MKDPFGRHITYLRLSVTELCNLRCRYCMPAAGIEKRRHEDMLTEEETVRAVKAAASLGLSKVRLTGGEPLVKKNILSIAEKVAGLETKVVAIETAAPLRDKILSDSILNLQATLSRIAVPMVPNYALAPGYGPAMVAPMPPFPVQAPVTGGTSTPATASTSTSAAA